MTWRKASLLAAKVAGKGRGLAYMIREWTGNYIEDRADLPVNIFGRHHCSTLEDEDLAQELHEHLQSLDTKYKSAMDILHYLDRPEVKERLKLTKKPHLRTAQHWMHAMEYQYGRPTNGMYVDGHE